MTSGSKNTMRLLASILVMLCTLPAFATEPVANAIQFNRDVRPILSDNCFHCHGPDQAQRQAELRLDTEEGAFAKLESGNRAIVAGRTSESELVRRIMSKDDGERMPPSDSGRSLTAAQKETLVRWVDQGAKWQKHWSLIRPERPAIPTVKNRAWPRAPWDAFVLARLEQEGLQPSPEADKETLIRRVTLDLTGLPPTLAEIDAFLRDDSVDAYEKLVDRLLASPRFGERMATDWLDAARYADTNGYQTDGPRSMWRWRDWVIDALNRNMPFDQFTIEQLAGDMLDGATLDQKIASGFNRNHRGNAEGGIIPQEYSVEYVVDRVETTATVFLGMTLGCARCHDHKFDPVSQKEFYQLFALFNNVPERGRAIKYGNSDPQIKAPTIAQQKELRDFDADLEALHSQLVELQPRIAQAQADWEQSYRSRISRPSENWFPDNGLIHHLPFDGETRDYCATKPAKAPKQKALKYSNGKVGMAAEFSGKNVVDLGNVANFNYLDQFSISCWIQPRSANGTLLGRRETDDDVRGYNLELSRGKLQLNLVVRLLDDALRVETSEPLTINSWQHVTVTYDGSRIASGIKIYIDGQPVPLHVLVDELNQDFAQKKESLLVGAGGPGPKYVGLIDELRIYDRVVTAGDAELLAVSSPIEDLIVRSPAARTPAESRKLAECFLDKYSPPAAATLYSKIIEVQDHKLKLERSVPTTMVMQEMREPRESFVLLRGQYDQPGERVLPGVPASLSWPGQVPIGNRLDLARWIVAPENPLTARVAVNRVWQLYFGQGIVRTANDFGSQGERPSHPELLDYLATQFIASGWDVKALHKSIVMSASYRQSSRATPELLQRDPENRLLARGPRVRLSAETIRDQALCASGLLAEQVGGPSVKPYQPDGLWNELSNAEYVQDHGESLYRRSMYTFWKRTNAPPAMVTFDAAGRESCRVLQSRTNTPLQALTLMNETTFVEAARKLAERALHDGGDVQEERLKMAFRLVLARNPSPAELHILTTGLTRHMESFRSHPESATKLLSVGESPHDEKLDKIELAAYAATANMILNLDEAITKQ